MRRLFGASRFVVGLAVIATFLGSALLLIMSTLTVIRLIVREIVGFDVGNLAGESGKADSASGRAAESGTLSSRHIDHLGVELIQITDIILLGTVLYIVSLGLYQLFIEHDVPLPRWLLVDDLNDLKRLLIGVTVVLLGVTFLGEVVEGDGEPSILQLGAAIALVIGALGIFLWVHPDETVSSDSASKAPTETGSAVEETPRGNP